MIKKHYKCQKIDFTIPYDTRVDDKEVEKTEKYLDLAKELKRAWIMKVTVVLLVTGALDTAAEVLEKKLNNIGIEKKITELQKLSWNTQQNTAKSSWAVRSLVDTIPQK